MAENEKKTQFARLRERIENSGFLAWVLVFGVSIISLSSFLEAIVKLRENTKALLPIEHRIAEFDAQTHEQVLRAAKAVDALLLRLADEGDEVNSFRKFRADYRAVEVELRNLSLRNLSRPLNQVSAKQSEVLLKLWINLRKLHATRGHVTRESVELLQRDFEGMFEEILRLEAAKLRGVAQ